MRKILLGGKLLHFLTLKDLALQKSSFPTTVYVQQII